MTDENKPPSIDLDEHQEMHLEQLNPEENPSSVELGDEKPQTPIIKPEYIKMMAGYRNRMIIEHKKKIQESTSESKTETTTISAVMTIDKKHVFSHSKTRQEILNYFETESFYDYALFAEVDDLLLRNISDGLTTYLHEQSSTNELLEWAGDAVAICSDAKVGRAKNDRAAHLILSLAITTLPDLALSSSHD